VYQWKPGHFEAVTPEGRFGVDGLIYRGLGLEPITDDEGGVWYDDWDVIDIASGQCLGTIMGLDRDEALKLAAVVADLMDESGFDGQYPSPAVLSNLTMLSDLSGGSFMTGFAAEPVRAPQPYCGIKR
jgi:hypothetical protein